MSITGYTPQGCSYLYNKLPNSKTTVVWIPGGGISSFVFAFSGVGPYMIRNNRIIPNPYSLPVSQLFIDAGGVGFSDIPFPDTDNQIVNLYVRCIKSFNLDNIILVGVSYGGKLAVLTANHLPNGMVKRVVGITPFFNAEHSMSNIPRVLERLGKYRMSDNDKIEYNRLKEQFSSYLSKRNYQEARKFMEDGGKFTQLSKRLLRFSGQLNMWNAHLYYRPTLSHWSIPNMLYIIQKFLEKQPIYPFMHPLYEHTSGIFSNMNPLNQSSHMINSLSWNQLAWSQNSYMKGVDLKHLRYPLSIISGDIDVLTSFDGHKDIWDSIHKQTKPSYLTNDIIQYRQGDNHLFRVANGTHLLTIAYPKQTRHIFSQFIN